MAGNRDSVNQSETELDMHYSSLIKNSRPLATVGQVTDYF